MTLLFSFHGRAPRSHYWLARLAALSLLVLIVAGDLAVMRADPPARLPLLGLFSLGVLAIDIPVLWSCLAIDVKRCHDRGKSGWFLLLGLLPFVSLWVLVELGFLDGPRGENRYGPSPRGHDPAVFS
ncbi:MAG: DUF805 domain-containing protein [Caulobacteraceae bacterium]|nr:DUF805 domain-containing protein [Caulobacteraceae bacterium]